MRYDNSNFMSGVFELVMKLMEKALYYIFQILPCIIMNFEIQITIIPIPSY
jgi:hypothetical protein